MVPVMKKHGEVRPPPQKNNKVLAQRKNLPERKILWRKQR